MPMFGYAARRSATALTLLLASTGLGTLPAAAMQPRESSPLSEYEPAESLEGNFLSAYIAGARRTRRPPRASTARR